METQKVPKRLKIKPHCSIDGVREGKRLFEGLYETNRNMTEDEAVRLASDEFRHCVEVLPDTPEPEALAKDSDLPQATPGFLYSRAKAHQAELQRWEMTHGKSVKKPEHLQDVKIQDL